MRGFISERELDVVLRKLLSQLRLRTVPTSQFGLQLVQLSIRCILATRHFLKTVTLDRGPIALIAGLVTLLFAHIEDGDEAEVRSAAHRDDPQA